MMGILAEVERSKVISLLLPAFFITLQKLG